MEANQSQQANPKYIYVHLSIIQKHRCVYFGGFFGTSIQLVAGPSWRSPGGLVVPPPAAPELHPADEFGFALSVRW